jgi:hypothetical protein
MKKFSDLNIKPKHDLFVGDKIKMLKVLNQEIIVHAYKIKESKFQKENFEKCLQIQIEFKGEKHVLFTGSKVLAETIQQVKQENLPFITTITKEGETFQFN